MIHIVIATLLQSFDWSLPNNLQPLDLDMSEIEGVHSTQGQSLIMIFKALLLMISHIVN